MRENRFSREREWEARRSYYAEARTRKSKINNWDSFSTTFFFCNFPFSCESSDLWRAFERLGTVLDVYISKKLTMKGSRFGFVRFKIDRDANRIEEGLNNTWFGSYRLRANVSKYDSKGSSRDTKTKQNEFRKKVMTAPSNNIEEGKLFTDALLNKGGRSFKGPLEGSKKNLKRQTSVQTSTKSMEAFSPPVLMLKETESAWLANCLVGELKHLMSIKNLESLLENENIRAGAVRFIGGNKILIDCLSKENKDSVFGNFEWWSVLFKWIVPWSLDFNTVGRVAKIKCYGVPLQAWCKETFFDIGSLWGDVIEIADETLDKSNLEMGMVTILTKHWETISNDIQVSLNNTLYNIRISEMVDAFKHQDWKSEEADSSLEDSSSEDYYSDSVAEHYLNGDDSGCSGEEDDRSVNSVQSINNDKVNLEKNEVTLGQQISAASSKSTKKESSSKGDASLNDRYPIMGRNDDVDPFSTSRANGPAGDEAQSMNGPHDISNIPETANSAHSANQVTVNISETLMDKLENISFSVNGIKERGFKSLAEIIENLDSNNLHMNFDNKKVKGKKNKDRKKKAVRVKGISQNEGISNYSNSNKFEKKSCSIDSELERREIEKVGLLLGVNFGKEGNSLTGISAC